MFFHVAHRCRGVSRLVTNAHVPQGNLSAVILIRISVMSSGLSTFPSPGGGGLSATFTWHSRSLLWNLCRNCLRGQNERKTTIKHEAVRVTSGIYIVPLIPPSPEGYFPACQSNAVVLCACGVVFMGMKERKEITPKDTKYTNMRLTLCKNMRDHPPLC